MVTTEVLRSQLPGRVFGPGDAEYDAARSTFVREGSPAAVVRPASTDDVAAAVRLAVESGTVLSVRSGGHGPTGQATNTGGLVVDLAELSAVEVGPGGLVHVGAGARWGDVAAALAPHGLAITSGDTTAVGVGGLTLGGGIGWLVRTHGLALDLLREVEVVTAAGGVVTASADEHPDLFWAVRGGGGNFGVVTRFTFAARPVGDIVSGRLSYDPADVAGVLRTWRDVLRAAPDELNSTLLVLPPLSPTMPPGPTVLVTFAGDEDRARELLAPLLALPSLSASTLSTVAYADLLEDPPPGRPPFTFVGGNGFVPELTDDALAAVGRVLGGEVPTMLMLRALGGAFGRVDPASTAIAYRDSEALLLVNALLPADAPADAVAAARGEVDAALAHTRGVYGNFSEQSGPDAVRAMFPPATLERLVAVKDRYDPANLFDQNHNIAPTRRRREVSPG